MAGAAFTIRGRRPPELEAWLERRRVVGADRFDEVWEGRYVVAPDPHRHHGTVMGELYGLLKRWPAGSDCGRCWRSTSAAPATSGSRTRDWCVDRSASGLTPRCSSSEVLSPEDMTFEKLDFCTPPACRSCSSSTGSVRCFALQDGQAERDRSEVLDMATADVVTAVEWPPPEA